MALLFLDSFDHYASADLLEKWSAVVGVAPAITAAQGRRGTAALACLGAARGLALNLTPGSATLVAGVALKLTTVGIQNNLLVVANSGVFHANLHVNVGGTLGIGRGGDAGSAPSAVLGTSTVALAVDTYYYLEVLITISDTIGAAQVRVNETPVLTLSSLDTNNGGASGWNQLRVSSRGTTSNFYLEDLYILDDTGGAPLNTFLGDCRVDPRSPTAEGASAAWTPLSGTDNALMVDETAPDDDTTYTGTPTIGATDTHVVQDAPVAGAVLYGAQLCVSQKKTDAGTCTIVPVVRHSGVDYPGPAVNPGTTYAYGVTPYGLNPGTGAAWTEAEFNAAEFGYTRTA